MTRQNSGQPAHTNRLIHETSPYLLQHAHNPVDWQAWSAAALEQARREDKPILLSIGYSACHWCHVMEHESFEDEGVAQVMNELFVCIKVDREERPDLDKIYQTAHQLLAQRPGGWPLNMFLAPAEHIPFFGGTYFPKTPRHGLPPFVEVLRRVAAYYRDHRADVEQQNAQVRAAFLQLAPEPPAPGLGIDAGVLDAAQAEMEQQFDPDHGGFGGAPKFPHPTSLERCLRYWAASSLQGTPNGKALEMARLSLHAMAAGGLYDQLGGGFCRYSVDEYWMIPHFEKMLYDNGPLLALYADAALATGHAEFRRIALETGTWAMREMQSPEGGYYSTLDADSEGHEGKFYVWTPEQVRVLLSAEEYQVFAPRFGLDRAPNFENEGWHLHVFQGADAIARAQRLDVARVNALLDNARQKLFEARERRVRPGRDEKILTAWNGLMIKGMARAGRLLDKPEYIASAGRALDFIRATLWKEGRLLATYKDGKAHLPAYLDDHAFLIDGLLELLQARWRSADLRFAVELAEVLLAHFQDKDNGGFYFTADDHEQLLHRPKPASDEAIPSGNGIAALALLRLGHLLGEPRYLDAAERTLKALYPALRRYPSAHNALLNAVEEYLEPTQTVVLRGRPETWSAWLSRCVQHYAPRRMVFAIPDGAVDLPAALASRAASGAVAAYICSGLACGTPVTELTELDDRLNDGEVRGVNR
ncbi:MAG: thioredoxin [Candidatus Muproteobacteria bacterium RBG_16_64_11]|uniref:Thioredoxin n=1 Tax=Candidatus Muproteobacteria bacterium RBG_16_64_11 TaxID=1817758 RepID=A0A1F6TC84_9PROT|nr:MAG: thioredoxin [Candidatus Muproteobacteria bacterium RBG_16_64_11]